MNNNNTMASSSSIFPPWQYPSHPPRRQLLQQSQQPQHYNYIAITLERPSLHERWGLSLSLMRSKFLIVGGISDSSTLAHRVTGLYSCHSTLPPTPFFQLNHKNNPVRVMAFLQHLLAHCPPSCTVYQLEGGGSIFTASLLPGDCILAINYQPVVPFFPSMKEITQVLACNQKVVLLVVRDTMAIQRAHALWSSSSLSSSSSSPPPPPPPLNNMSMILNQPRDTSSSCLEGQIAIDALKYYERFLGETTTTTTPITTTTTTTTTTHYLNNCNPKKSATPRPYQKGTIIHQPRKSVAFGSTKKPAPAISSSATVIQKPPISMPVKKEKHTSQHHHSTTKSFCFYRNPLFLEEGTNLPLPYADDQESDPDDGKRAHLFLPPIPDFSFWLANRKQEWRKSYKVYQLEQVQHASTTTTTTNMTAVRHHTSNHTEPEEERTVAVDFWTPQGFSTFERWLKASTARWKSGYSWNQQKRKRIEQDYEEVVHLTSETFGEWLRVRKNQWRVLRRKRQRKLRELEAAQGLLLASARPGNNNAAASAPPEIHKSEMNKAKSEMNKAKHHKDNNITKPLAAALQSPISVSQFPLSSFPSPSSYVNDQFAVIDAFLEDEERQQKAAQVRPPFDLMLLFDESNNAPDDIVVLFLEFLATPDHLALLACNKQIRRALTERHQVWRSLCPPRWTLPRRPRKPWLELYFTNLRTEQEQTKKMLDDLLSRAAQLLFKGDQLQSIEKLVSKAEKEASFDINYSSGVVCERNSLLNLAAIHKRHKVVRWLVEQKGADIESRDRGGFTPLLNAAWAGDKYLVRFFLQKGADRAHVGFSHYTRPLAPPDFKGRTAAGWAKFCGHDDIAKLIERGL